MMSRRYATWNHHHTPRPEDLYPESCQDIDLCREFPGPTRLGGTRLGFHCQRGLRPPESNGLAVTRSNATVWE